MGAYVSLVAFLKMACITVGEQITVEQLIEKRIMLGTFVHTFAYFMFLQRDFSLTSSSVWTSTFSLLPQLRSCALGRIW